jgi:acyl-CoA hydrolase
MIKTVEDSKTEQVYIVRSMHINGFGRLFGGQLLQWIDELAGIVCRRHSGMGVTTASIDNLNFRRAAYQNDMIVLVGKLSYVGRTSMEVRVDTFIENEQGIRTNINRAYIVMVAIDQEGKPVPVPGIEIKTAEEELEWQSGEKRYHLRKARKVEGY